MIGINNICWGWADLRIGDNFFEVSYLSNLIECLDNIFYLKKSNRDYESKRTILDGESKGDLSLVSYLTYEDEYMINIIWDRIYCDNEYPTSIMKFPYDLFIKSYEQLKKNIMNKYIMGFICVHDLDEYICYYNKYNCKKGDKNE